MTRNWLLLFPVAVLATLPGSPAVAHDPASGSKKIEDPARTDRRADTPEQTREVGRPAAPTRELNGTVVKSDAKTVYLEHMGAVVPLRIDEKTQFSGKGVKSSRDLVEGQQVRASFTVEETTNLAQQITVASASEQAPGGTGTEGMPPGHPEGVPGQPPVPPERAPGVPPGRQPVPRDPGSAPPRDPGSPPAAKH